MILKIAHLATLAACAHAFLAPARSRWSVRLSASTDFTDDERFDSVSGMRVSEIKAELDLRGVLYDDCFEADELRRRLEDARLSGKADVSVVDNFNRIQEEAKAENADEIDEFDEEQLASLLAGDGTLPGGLSPEEVMKMRSSPELMAVLQNPSFQRLTKAQMAGDQEEVLKLLSDPEVSAVCAGLFKTLEDLGIKPPEQR